MEHLQFVESFRFCGRGVSFILYLGLGGVRFRLGRALGHFIFSLIGLKTLRGSYLLVFFEGFKSPT